MCCDAEWKREVVQDHKWDFINVNEFHKTDFWTRIKYVWRYILLFKSIAVYGLDIFTAVTMISSDRWTNAITSRGSEGVVEVKFIIAKWVFVGCIIFSFLLLGYEWFKARQVIRSRDISYAFTNLLAYDYFSFKKYDNFCLFCHIDESTKKKDDFAFFIFFTFKEWKRLLLADGPRQSINGLMLYSFGQANGWQTSNIPAYWDQDPVTAMLLFSMIATVLIFAGSMVLLIAAAVLYVPLLCYIQGNLKEYVCHKVDKRLSELVKKKQRLRAQRAAALEKKLARDGGLRNSKGEFVNVVLQPTLPKIQLDEEDLRETKTGMSRSKSGDSLSMFPARPPLPSAGSYDPQEAYGGYPPTIDYGAGVYSSEGYGSSTRLLDSAGPMGISYPPVIGAPPASAIPVFPPRSASPIPPPTSMSPSRSNTHMTSFSSHSGHGYGHAPCPPSSLTPGLNSHSPPLPTPTTYSQPSALQIPRTTDGGYRHQGEHVLSPSAYSSQSPSSSFARTPIHTRNPSFPVAHPQGNPPPSRTSIIGLPYDRSASDPTDIDIDLDAYGDPDPAPSYYAGAGAGGGGGGTARSPPRRLTDDKRNRGLPQGYGGYGQGGR